MQPPPARPSLVAHTAQTLREALGRGAWKEFLPGERNLCAWLQVSRPTLRAALAQLQSEKWLEVSHGKRRRILRAQRSSPHTPASRLVAVLSPVPLQAMPPFAMVWVDVLRGLVGKAGFQLEVHTVPQCYRAKPAARLKSLMQRVSATAWVLFRSTTAMQQWFATHAPRAVVAGSCDHGVHLPSVDLDYRATCRHAAGLLLKKGHRRIALVLPGVIRGGDLESEHGFREALQHRHGTGVAPVVLRCGEAASKIVERLHAALHSTPSPSAFLVARSMHALTVLTHLLSQGFRLPGDLALISRDDDEFMAHVVPSMARYSADPAKFARKLARIVLELATSGSTSLRAVRMMPTFRSGETA